MGNTKKYKEREQISLSIDKDQLIEIAKMTKKSGESRAEFINKSIQNRINLLKR